MPLSLSSQMYSNQFVVDGTLDLGGDGCGKQWQSIGGVEEGFDYHEDRGRSNEGVNDILDVLPTDPFGMDISTTFAAITGWLEDFNYSAFGSYEVGLSKGEYELYAGFNIVWNSDLRFHTLPVSVGVGTEVDDVSFESCRFDGDAVTQQSDFFSCCNIAAGCNVDDIVHKLPTVSIFHDTEYDQSVSEACLDEDNNSPHQAFFFALGYLGVSDLLATEGVCRSLRSTIKTDPLLWRNIGIERPLHEKLNDEILVQLTNRAQCNLNSLSLVECSWITDDGLKRVLENNPRLTELNVSGCTRLSIDGILSVLSSSNNQVFKIRIGGVYGMTQKHLDDFKMLLATGKSSQTQNSRKPHIYSRDSYYLPFDDDRCIDVEPCPICQNVRLVYDCPVKNCPGIKAFQTCRACAVCIQRCSQCGQCINESVFVENFCLEYLCADCSNQLPNHHESGGNNNAQGEPLCDFTAVG